ncbi:MAG: hypothetical protein ACRCZI_03885 [Cetobacterium sp.]
MFHIPKRWIIRELKIKPLDSGTVCTPKMIHEYMIDIILHFLDNNNIIYVTKNEIIYLDDVCQFFGTLVPDIIIYDNINRRNVLIDLHTSDYILQDIINKRNTYEKLKLFGDFYIINHNNLNLKLKHVKILPEIIVDYIYNNIQLFINNKCEWSFRRGHVFESDFSKDEYIKHIHNCIDTSKSFKTFTV